MKKGVFLIAMFLLGAGCTHLGVVEGKSETGERARSIQDFTLCNLDDLSQELAEDFDVYVVEDKPTSYKYYSVSNGAALNANAIRGKTCSYVMEKKCYLYWGNVLNTALIAARAAPKFPLDTTPSYMLSPYITCQKLQTK